MKGILSGAYYIVVVVIIVVGCIIGIIKVLMQNFFFVIQFLTYIGFAVSFSFAQTRFSVQRKLYCNGKDSFTLEAINRTSSNWRNKRPTNFNSRSRPRSAHVAARPGYNYTFSDGDIIEYMSNKGSKTLAVVCAPEKTSYGVIKARSFKNGPYFVYAINERTEVPFSVPINKVTYHISSSQVEKRYTTADLVKLSEIVDEFLPSKIDRLWKAAIAASNGTSHEGVNLTFIAEQLFKKVSDPINLYLSHRMMDGYGKIYFAKQSPSPSPSPHRHAYNPISAVYSPLPSQTVEDNLKVRAALREFKQRYIKIMTKSYSKVSFDGSSYYPSSPAELPERVDRVLQSYSEGLKQLVFKNHPWVVNGLAKIVLNQTELSRGLDLLEFLDLSPTLRNAKKVLEIMGVWSAHENVEKYIMCIRDQFPADVLAEAQYLLDNWQLLQDPDERLRRDLRYLRCYAIDREGATEVDDAVSIELLENGQEKLWVHIADVSRWIRPGSRLSLEAECRMSSVYMPDDRISMFPDTLSSELLSLGAKKDSFAISCGVTLDESGEVTSYEVCPTKIRVTHKLSYIQLDEILQRSKANSSTEQDDRDISCSSSNVSSSSNSSELQSDQLQDNSDHENIMQPSRSFGVNNGRAVSRGRQQVLQPYGTYPDDQQPVVISELGRLYFWAVRRHNYRIRKGALDEYLRHKTELYLTVKRDLGRQQQIINGNTLSQSSGSSSSGGSSSSVVNLATGKSSVSGFTSWSNASSMCLVSEYMILMCQTIGELCVNQSAPVWFKTQVADPPLSAADLELRPRETPFTRAARIIMHLRSSNDSKTPGPHCSSGSSAYVQCTSPIRRYHDLYNHYRLKAAMHEASLGAEWADRAREEAGISLLESMATAEIRLNKLNAIKMVMKNRVQYWLSIYMSRLVQTTPRPVFDCIIHFANLDGGRSTQQPLAITETVYSGGHFAFILYDVIIMQLGSFTRYKMYHEDRTLQAGDVIQCHLHRRVNSPVAFILIPTAFDTSKIHPSLTKDVVITSTGATGGANSRPRRSDFEED